MLASELYITFHGIGEPRVPLAPGEERYFVSREQFEMAVETLHGLEERYAIRANITFDDGNLSDFEVGLPVLQKHGRKGRFFVLAGRIGKEGYLSAGQIRELAASGMEIGSHGYDHVDWRGLDQKGRQREFTDARRKIEDVLGKPVMTAALPFGGFDQHVLAHLKTAGFQRVFTSSQGLAMRGSWFCPRRSLTRDFDPASGLAEIVKPPAKFKGVAYALARRLRYRF
ncbi:polysaccharide deacetylase family protein [Rhizobiales bacterium]|uniref:polysaccharide deacetylase family protein n=1 Tax=Hongsoonwoonella zoysiae TaxID=2821844 RepID=UPI001560E6BA|nr:polysaccharide deacetylase family protein [Hongsoonwoonella zoysiae]NRG16349.1 polysaccharide deacetylase family protein [Hongsoonwoonella zoysiae]